MKLLSFKEKNLTRVQALTVIIGFILLGGKFIAYFLTNSNAVLTDALESIVNVVAGIFTLYSLVLSAKPKDKNHPYGHGKIEFIAASIEGVLISIAGILIIGKSIYNLFEPVVIQQLDIGLYIIIAAGAINFILGQTLINTGKRNQSLPLIASGNHLKSDAYSTIGLVIGLILLLIVAEAWLDNAIAICFGAFILYTGIKILKPSIAGIMDEADYKVIERLIAILNENRKEEWVDIHNLRVIKYGKYIHVDCHVTLPWYWNVKRAHLEIDRIEEIINLHSKNLVEVFIHTDYCMEYSCQHCFLKDCKERIHAFEEKIEWKLEIVMKNKKHQLDSQ